MLHTKVLESLTLIKLEEGSSKLGHSGTLYMYPALPPLPAAPTTSTTSTTSTTKIHEFLYTLSLVPNPHQESRPQYNSKDQDQIIKPLLVRPSHEVQRLFRSYRIDTPQMTKITNQHSSHDTLPHRVIPRESQCDALVDRKEKVKRTHIRRDEIDSRRGGIRTVGVDGCWCGPDEKLCGVEETEVGAA
jgi:hypothetical protein